MNAQVLLLILLSGLMLAAAIVPNRLANRFHLLFRTLSQLLVGAACLFACGFALFRFSEQTPPMFLQIAGMSRSLELSIYYDNITALMLCLVTFLGLITCRFSVRYLDGEQTQGQFFKWMTFTIGAVSLMVVSGNLLMFLLAWFITSVGMHQLLTHYGHRPQARKAAYIKFAFGRLGDGLILIAIALMIELFGSQNMPDILEESKQLWLLPESVTQLHSIIVWLLVLGVAIKTAQVPFHAWLPETMETPTPVSAFMHAGVVNAGGYLLIRIHPVLALNSTAMATLAIIGTVTAILGVVAMATQTSVKRSLAYSTVAQMGFMMLQCGLGAFTAALLHILAHSMYKAYAFLNSGSVDFQPKPKLTRFGNSVPPLRNAAYLLTSLILSAVQVLLFSHLFQLDLFAKPGGIPLAFILTLALGSWSWKLLLGNQHKAKIRGLIAVALACAASMGSYQLIDYLTGKSLVAIPQTAIQYWAYILICIAFGVLFLMHVMIASGWRNARLERIRIHATNGFYFSAAYQRFFANLLTS